VVLAACGRRGGGCVDGFGVGHGRGRHGQQTFSPIRRGAACAWWHEFAEMELCAILTADEDHPTL